MILSIFNCGKCGHKLTAQGTLVCAINGKQIDPTGICDKYTESPYHCELCGQHLTASNCVIELGISAPYHLLCHSCSEAMGGCRACKHENICTFRSDTSIREPQIVNQTIQQGNTRIQTQVKNPARIKLTCEKCKCYHGEECCKEEIARCGSFENGITGW